MKHRRIISLLIAIALAVSLTACGRTVAPSSTATSTQSVTEEAGNDEAPPPTHPADGAVTYPLEDRPSITIARMLDTDLPTAGYTSYNDTPNVKAWSEAIGADIEFIELPSIGGNDYTAFLLYLASGNLADAILISKTVYPGSITAMHSDGLAVELTELLPQYAPDYWDLLNSDTAYLNSVRQPDGSHYNMGGYFFELGSPYRAWLGLAARQEFLDELDMEPPETANEVYEYLSRCKEEPGVATPLMSDKNRWDHMYRQGGGALFSPFGLVTTALYQVDGEVHYGAFEAEYKDYLAWMNKLYAEGLLDPNFAVTDEATAQSAMMSGQSALIYTAASRINTMMQSHSGGEAFNLTGLKNLRQADGGEPLFTFFDPYVTGGFNVCIPESTPEEKIPAVLMAFNYILTPEGRLLSNYGIEGVTYEMMDGRPTLTEFATNNPDGHSLDGILRSYGMMNFPLIMEINMSKQRFPLEAQTAAIANWANSQADNYKVINDSIAPEFTDEYAGLYTDILTYIEESRAQFIAGSLPIDSFDTVYLPRLQEMGCERLLEIYQSSYDMYNK